MQIYFVVLLVIIIITFLYFHLSSYDQTENIVHERKQLRVDAGHSKRWIVVTTIQQPTADIKRLSQLDDWVLLVVGDTKTPPDWHLPGALYLSLETQAQLNFSVTSELPRNSYTRKIIGYLYAIKHGAEWIYDTDDDNKPYGEGLKSFDYEEYVSGLRYTSSGGQILFNPYSYFGNQDMWPRGFPLDQVKSHSNNNTMMLCARMRSAAVQQGLVHNDPDVDAIYRLLNADKKKGLSKSFNPYTPQIQLDKKVYAPWNSQNTLFHRRAFFTMFLPTTVAFRVTDIWRSYFSQRLLHLIGEHVAFYPVNAVQQRNAHDYLKDFKDERAVYEKSGDIVQFIDSWKCSRTTIEECTIELADAFAEQKFWDKEDAKLVHNWIRDLGDVGYKFPPLKEAEELSYVEHSFLSNRNTHFRALNCRRARLSFTEPTAATDEVALLKRAEEKIQNWRDIAKWCEIGKYHKLLDGIRDRDEIIENHRINPGIHQKLGMALIVANNWPWKWSMGLLQRMYEPYFATVIFCGTIFHGDNRVKDHFPQPTSRLNYIHMTEKEVNKGYFVYQCLAHAHRLRLRNIKGFVFTSDDVAYNHWHYLNETVPISEQGVAADENWWTRGPLGYVTGYQASRQLAKKLKTKYKYDHDVQDTWMEFEMRLQRIGVINRNENALEYLTKSSEHTLADWLFLPSSEMSYFQRLSDLFSESHLFLEFAVGKYLRSTPFVRLGNTSISLWARKREQWPKYYHKNLVMLHPLKLSTLGQVNTRKLFCANIAQVHVNVTLKFEQYDNAKPVNGCPRIHFRDPKRLAIWNKPVYLRACC